MSYRPREEREARYKQNWLQQFRAFYYVYKTGSFTQAAETLYLEQPTISLQIAALEREFQVRLLERGRGPATATPEGEVLFELVAPVVEAVETIRESFQGRLAQLERGEVRCAAGEGLSTYVLPSIIMSFHEKHPEIDVALITARSEVSWSLIAKGEVDAVIVPTTEEPVDFAGWVLGPCSPYLVTPHHHRLAKRHELVLSELAGSSLILSKPYGPLWSSFLEFLAKNNLNYRVSIQINNPEARLRLVHDGVGVTILQGARRASPLADGVTWIPLSEYLQPVIYRMIARRHGYLSLATKRFIEHVVANWPQEGM